MLPLTSRSSFCSPVPNGCTLIAVQVARASSKPPAARTSSSVISKAPWFNATLHRIPTNVRKQMLRTTHRTPAPPAAAAPLSSHLCRRHHVRPRRCRRVGCFAPRRKERKSCILERVGSSPHRCFSRWPRNRRCPRTGTSAVQSSAVYPNPGVCVGCSTSSIVPPNTPSRPERTPPPAPSGPKRIPACPPSRTVAALFPRSDPVCERHSPCRPSPRGSRVSPDAVEHHPRLRKVEQCVQARTPTLVQGFGPRLVDERRTLVRWLRHRVGHGRFS